MPNLSDVLKASGYQKKQDQYDLIELMCLAGLFNPDILERDMREAGFPQEQIEKAITIAKEAMPNDSAGKFNVEHVLTKLFYSSFATWPKEIHQWLILGTQREFFARAAGQERWEQPTGKWIKDNETQLKIIYERLGLEQAVSPSATEYEAIAILGATKPEMVRRINYIKNLIDEGKIKAKKIYLLTGQRPAANADGSETDLQAIALSQKIERGDLMETHMMNDAYQHNKGNGIFATLPCTTIDTPKGAKGQRPTTVDTVKQLCLDAPNLSGSVLFISRAPNIYAQKEDILGTLGPQSAIKAEVVGDSCENVDLNRLTGVIGGSLYGAYPRVACELGYKGEIPVLLEERNQLNFDAQMKRKGNLSSYPNLEKNFNKLDPAIKGWLTFDVLEKQLAWSFNDYEQKRAIHRLHCVITSLLLGNNPYFQKLSAGQKQALIVLTILDGCKNSNKSIVAYSEKGYTALKDSVPSLFDMLAKAPEIFPSYNQLSVESKDAIKNNFFYLHLRHLQLGEVPVASVSKQTLERPQDLMIAFWYANATGFNIEKPGYPIGENTGPSINAEQNDQFEKLVNSLEKRNLTDYYAQDSIFKNRPNLKESFTPYEIEFICRLGKMLSYIGLKEDDNNYLEFVAKNSTLIKEHVALEVKTFSKHNIEAFTFLPAVFKALKERIMPEKQIGEIIVVFLSLQKQLYLSTPNIIKNIGDNKTIPLFGLSSTQDQMLNKFSSASNKQEFHFDVSMNNFINVNLVDGPVPEAIISKQAVIFNN